MCYLHPQTQQVAPLDSNDTCIQMSHWHHTMVEDAKIWISYQRPAFLSISSRWQLIQYLAPSTIMWGQCDPRLNNSTCFFFAVDVLMDDPYRSAADQKQSLRKVIFLWLFPLNRFFYCSDLILVVSKQFRKKITDLKNNHQ